MVGKNDEKSRKGYNPEEYQPPHLLNKVKNVEGAVSDQKKAVILISPEDPKALSNPVKVAKALKDSAFCKYRENINVNKRKNLIVVEVEDSTQAIQRLVECKMLGDIPVSCKDKLQQQTPSERNGVIYPISADINLEDLLPEIKVKLVSEFDDEAPPVIKLERLKKKIGPIMTEDSESEDYLQG